MIHIISWLFFGIVVGLICKALFPNAVPVGLASTLAVGIGGSFVGGLIDFLIIGHHYHPSGFLMSIVGGIICCMAYRYFIFKNDPTGPRNFITGKQNVR